MIERDLGVQPLSEIMDKMELKNPDLVRVSAQNLTCKQVNKAKRGRRVTRNIQLKVTNALNAFLDEKDPKFLRGDLFNYR